MQTIFVIAGIAIAFGIGYFINPKFKEDFESKKEEK